MTRAHDIRWCFLMVAVIAMGVVLAAHGEAWLGGAQVALGLASLTFKIIRLSNLSR